MYIPPNEDDGNKNDRATLVASSPDEEAYVMVLQDRTGQFGNASTMSSLSNYFDVTFLVGEDEIPVHGIRAICSKVRILQQSIESAESIQQQKKQKSRSKIRNTVAQLGIFTCGVVRTRSRRRQKLQVPLQTYDVETFKRLMKYIHCGTLVVDPSTVVGVMYLAHQFELPEVLKACRDFAVGCAVRPDNLLDLLVGARKYPTQPTTIAVIRELKERKSEFPATQQYEETFNSFKMDAVGSAGVNVT